MSNYYRDQFSVPGRAHRKSHCRSLRQRQSNCVLIAPWCTYFLFNVWFISFLLLCARNPINIELLNMVDGGVACESFLSFFTFCSLATDNYI